MITIPLNNFSDFMLAVTYTSTFLFVIGWPLAVIVAVIATIKSILFPK